MVVIYLRGVLSGKVMLLFHKMSFCIGSVQHRAEGANQESFSFWIFLPRLCEPPSWMIKRILVGNVKVFENRHIWIHSFSRDITNSWFFGDTVHINNWFWMKYRHILTNMRLNLNILQLISKSGFYFTSVTGREGFQERDYIGSGRK